MRTGLAVVTQFVVAAVLSAQAPQPPSSHAGAVPRATFDEWMTRVSNAGRWGTDDELGALNLITEQSRLKAVAAVRSGRSVSLAHDILPGPNPRALKPVAMEIQVYPNDSSITWAVDELSVIAHGWAYTHLDAIAHGAYRGRMYNGFGPENMNAPAARRLGVQNMRAGISGRAVLFDMPRLLGVPYLASGTAITAEHLERWERMHGVRVEPGDIVLIRTGRWAREQAEPTWDSRSSGGPHPSIALWLKERGASVLGGDLASEIYPSVVPGVSEPLHMLALVAMGMPIFDNLDLEEAAREAAAASRWTFLFVAAPPRVVGATGALVNPIAIF